MSYRNLSFVVCVCLAASAAAFGQANQGTGYLFQYAGYPSTSSQFLGYVATGNLNASINTSGPSGISQIIPNPNGSGFYLIGAGTTSAIQFVNSTFTSPVAINGFGAPPTAAAITPNGNYLLVAADAFYIIDTATNLVVSTLQMNGTAAYGADDVAPSTPVPTNGYCVSCWIAVSRDSSTAYVLTNLNGVSEVNTYNLTAKTRGTTINGLGGDATSISISPLGMVYVTASNRIFVIDPIALEVTANGTLELFDFEPYALRYSPDGTTAYAVNRIAAQAGESMLQLNLSNNEWAYWPAARNTSGAPQLDDIFVASNTRLFAYSSALTTLYDVTASPFAATQSTSLGLSNTAVENVAAVAITNEVPTAQSLFLLVNNINEVYLYREGLVSSSTSTQVLAALSTGQLQFAVVPPETAPAYVIPITTGSQNLTPGTSGVTSQPLIARVTNVSGQPVFNVQTTFSADPNDTGITINTPTPTTNADGYVQTTVTIASGATCPNASCNITLTAGTASNTFTITLPISSSGPGGGGGSSSSQVTIVGGNGQMLSGLSGGVIQIPLQVQVTDTSGNPLSGVTVTFQVTSGNGGLTAATSVTDSNGYASPAACNSANQPVTGCVYFTAAPLAAGVIETDYVAASTQYGTATFTELIFEPTDYQGTETYPVQVSLSAPVPASGFELQIPAGGSLPDAIIAQINATPSSQTNGGSPPIGGVAVAVVTETNGQPDLTVPPPASCQSGTGVSSATTGTAQCTLVAACQTGYFSVEALVGNYSRYSGTIQVTRGGASQIAVVSATNNQSGTAGQSLQPLVANITDGCNNAVSGVAVTWTVTQGSATLVNTVTSSNLSGQVSTGITLGQTPGTVTVRLSATGLPSVTFTLTNSVVVTGISVQSGNTQTATQGTAFTNPLTFVVSGNAGPISGILVTFVVASGSASVNPTSATTNAQGVVSTTVTAGTVPGAVVITANGAGFTATANLTVLAAGPSITSGSFYNAASFQPGLVPCGLATVIGNGIAPNITGVISGNSGFGPLPYTLGGLSITLNLEPVPLYSISNENGTQQATFQTPCDLAPGTALAVVSVNNGTPTTITGVPVLAAQPGIFTYAGPNNIQYGAVISASNGSYVTPSNLAVPGQTYYMVVTGLGQTNPATTTNSAGIAGENVDAQIIVGVNNAGVPVVSAQYLAGSIGVYIVGFQIPANASPGTNVPLAIAAVINNGGQVVYGNPVFLPGIQ